MISYVVIFVAGFVVAAITRTVGIYLYRIWFYQGFTGDSSIHFSIIRHLKRDAANPFIDQYLMGNEPMCYPLGFHRIAKLFSEDTIKKYSWLPNLCIFSFFTAAYLDFTHYVEKVLLLRDGNALLYTVAFVYFVSISNLVFNGPAIAYIKLSERLLGRMSTSFYFLLLFAYLYWGSNLSLALSVIFGGVAVLSSIFARQSLLFTTMLLSLLSFDPMPLLSVVCSFTLAVVLSGRYFLRGMKNTVRQWSIYHDFVSKSLFVQQAMSSFISLKGFIDNVMCKGILKMLKKAVLYFLSKEPTRAIAYYPEIVLLGWLILFVAGESIDLYHLIAPVLATVVVYFATSTQFLNQLGESYRYIEYDLSFILPLAVGLVAVHSQVSSSLILFVFYSAYVSAFVVFSAWYFSKAVVRGCKIPQKDSLSEFLDSLGLAEEAVVFPVTMRFGADICARGNYRSFWWQPGVINTSFLDEFIEEYPYLKKDWLPLCKKYNVTHVIHAKSAIEKIDWQYDFSDLRLLKETDSYIAYEVTV
ncbi:MAG: hypothetical protein H7843_06625 [Nitrospirota bacterium]